MLCVHTPQVSKHTKAAWVCLSLFLLHTPRLMTMTHTHPLQDQCELLLGIQANVSHSLNAQFFSARFFHQVVWKKKKCEICPELLTKRSVVFLPVHRLPVLRIVSSLALQALQFFNLREELPTTGLALKVLWRRLTFVRWRKFMEIHGNWKHKKNQKDIRLPTILTSKTQNKNIALCSGRNNLIWASCQTSPAQQHPLHFERLHDIEPALPFTKTLTSRISKFLEAQSWIQETSRILWHDSSALYNSSTPRMSKTSMTTAWRWLELEDSPPSPQRFRHLTVMSTDRSLKKSGIFVSHWESKPSSSQSILEVRLHSSITSPTSMVALVWRSVTKKWENSGDRSDRFMKFTPPSFLCFPTPFSSPTLPITPLFLVLYSFHKSHGRLEVPKFEL